MLTTCGTQLSNVTYFIEKRNMILVLGKTTLQQEVLSIYAMETRRLQQLKLEERFNTIEK